MSTIMRRNALAAAAADLRWEREGQRLLDLYTDLFPAHPPPRGEARNGSGPA